MSGTSVTEVSYGGRAIEDEAGRLVAVVLIRQEVTYPVTRAGSRQWTKRSEETTETTYAADEIPGVVRELASWLAYFATAASDKDKAGAT